MTLAHDAQVYEHLRAWCAPDALGALGVIAEASASGSPREGEAT
jgi:hypothetical protein